MPLRRERRMASLLVLSHAPNAISARPAPAAGKRERGAAIIPPLSEERSLGGAGRRAEGGWGWQESAGTGWAGGRRRERTPCDPRRREGAPAVEVPGNLSRPGVSAVIPTREWWCSPVRSEKVGAGSAVGGRGQGAGALFPAPVPGAWRRRRGFGGDFEGDWAQQSCTELRPRMESGPMGPAGRGRRAAQSSAPTRAPLTTLKATAAATTEALVRDMWRRSG